MSLSAAFARRTNVAHVAVWLGSAIIAFGLLALLLLRNPLLSMGIDDHRP